MEGGLCYLAVRAALASKPRKITRPWGCVASSATSATPSSKVTDGGPPSKQALKPLGGLAARIV